LVAQGIDVISDSTQLVHVSGHPRRAEMAKMYAWLRPKIAIPAHGEAVHLSEHARFARAQRVGEVVRALNGDVVQLAPGRAAIVGQLDHGRLYKDGEILLPSGDDCIAQRRRLSFSGVVSIALALSSKGDLAGDPDVMIAGLPGRTRAGAGMDEVVDSAIFETFESLPRGKRRDADAVSTAVERAVRNAVNAVWGKKPAVHVLVVEV
jgi:ribonuclease J